MSSISQNHAMVVLSGGQDSTTCLGWALANYERVSCVSFFYGQRHSIELKAAREVVNFFQASLEREIAHEVVTLDANVFAGTSPLTSWVEPLETYANHDQMEGIIGDRVEKTFVPMRNAVFLMLAANRAVVAGAGVLVTGVCQADNANYPDCRDVFIRSAEDTINLALGLDKSAYDHFRVATPLMNMSKAQSIQFAMAHPSTYEALAWSHTAYDGRYPPTGKDHASILRAHGFEEAGVPDPLVIRAVSEGLMQFPELASNYEMLLEGAEPLEDVVPAPVLAVLDLFRPGV